MTPRPPIRVSAAIAAIALAACLGSCSDSPQRHNTISSSAWTGAYGSSTRDRDNDGDKNDDDGLVLAFGHVPSAAEMHELTALVQRYFMAAAAQQGARACSMLAPFVAESVAERNGRSLGVHSESCGPVMTRLFHIHHAELQAKQPTMKVLRVRVEGNRSLIALEFPAIREDRQTVARRIDGRWRILDLLDGIIE